MGIEDRRESEDSEVEIALWDLCFLPGRHLHLYPYPYRCPFLDSMHVHIQFREREELVRK